MMEDFNQCLICSNDLKHDGEVKDYFGSKEVFKLKVCSNCDTKYTLPRPSLEEIDKYYHASSYISHGDSKGSVFDTLYKSIQKRNLQNKRRIILQHNPAKTVLDYGCGAGSFINYMSERGHQVVGVEPEDKARKLINNKLETYASLEHIKNQFDVITLYHVLEHVHSFNETLDKLLSLLAEQGILILALPNYKSFDAEHYQKEWAGYDVPRHLYHFSQKSIKTLAEKLGLKLVAMEPMRFDSYYVSLLSEKYQGKPLAPFSALLRGFQSNRKATNTGEYSSIIYILRR